LWDSKVQAAVSAPAVDVSVAVATERGLITPIVKAANTKSVAQVRLC
jgi:pyruvate/2-oxoglutarate dehydrogenase complex dihydrolipoamide acyltransferase (E2) component